MPDSLADLRRMRETVKKSLQSQTSEPHHPMSDRGVEMLGSGYDARTLSSVTSLADTPRYVDATGQPVRPPSSHQLHPSDSVPLSHGDTAVATTSPPPLTSAEDVQAGAHYPPSSSVSSYSYVSVPEVVPKGVSHDPRGAAVSYNLEDRMSELSVGGGTFDPGYPTTSDIPGSVYGSTASGHHSIPPSASYSTVSTAAYSGPEYRQSASGRGSSHGFSGVVMTTAGSHSGRVPSEEDQLREQVRLLRQQLNEKQATIAELQQPQYPGLGASRHHTSPGHSAMLGYAGEQQSSRHSGPITHHATYGGTVQVPVSTIM